MIKGLVTAGSSRRHAGRAQPDKVEPLIDGLVAEDLAETSADAFRLTSEGRLRALDVFAADRERAGGEEACVAALDRFILLDGRMKDLVTAWQIRDVANQVFNDHTDAAYDASILEQLGVIHGGVVELLTPLGHQALADGLLPRTAGACPGRRPGRRPRSSWRRRRVDSYHTVWFELHEDLIRLSGRLRSDETAAGRA